MAQWVEVLAIKALDLNDPWNPRDRRREPSDVPPLTTHTHKHTHTVNQCEVFVFCFRNV